MRKQRRIDAQCSPHFLGLASTLVFLIIGASAHANLNGVPDADASRISVTAVAGDVDVTMAGKAVAVAPSTTVVLPARVVTGSDGNVGLTQAGTHINVANDTDVEIPAEAVDGNLIARLVQHRGNVFYDVAPRELGTLRIETPLLVAVIKGTQFNVAVQEDSTTISLFEGRLEIRTPDGSEVVQLNAGEIAIRSRVDNAIRIVGMDDERVAAPGPRPASAVAAAAAAADARLEAGDAALTARVVLPDEGATVRSDGAESQVVFKPVLDSAAVDGLVGVSGGTLDVGLDANVGVSSGRIDVGLATGVDLGSGALDVGLDAGVDLGAAAVDVGLDAGVDLGAGQVDVGLDTGVDLGAVVVDTGLDAGLDLGGALDVGLDAGADLGGVVDTSLDAGVTLDTGTVDVDLDAGLDLGTVVDAGLDVDLGSGGLDVDLDLGLGGGGAAPQPPSGGLGGLLGGLL
jgi:hypothetical protein